MKAIIALVLGAVILGGCTIRTAHYESPWRYERRSCYAHNGHWDHIVKACYHRHRHGPRHRHHRRMHH